MNAHLITSGLAQFAPTTNHYQCDDGKYLLVTVDDSGDDVTNALPILAAIPVTETRRDYTTVYLADADAHILDADGDPVNGLTPYLRLPAGTPHDVALQAAGYTLED